MYKYSFGAKQFVEQLRRSVYWAEKVRAAIIMQAWLDGYEVEEYQDEIVTRKSS